MYAYSLFSLAFAKCPLNVFSALAFVSILGGFGKFTYLIGGIQLYKLSFKEGEIYEISSETRESPHASCSSTAVLPICGILMGIGYRLCPATMQGGEISGAVNLIGLFLVKAGAALIDNMAILFAIGVGVGMSEKNDGTGGIAALASWLMITTLLSTGVVTTIIRPSLRVLQRRWPLTRSKTRSSVSWPVSSDLPAITVSKTPSFRTGYPSSAANAV